MVLGWPFAERGEPTGVIIHKDMLWQHGVNRCVAI
jgi:hypothetical protein